MAIIALLITFAGRESRAQYVTDFESPSFLGSPTGVNLSGQDGFYVPSNENADGRCYAYTGNTLGIVPNPAGATQFVATTRISGAFAISEREVTVTFECWQLEVDINIDYLGTLPTANYAGSLSLQPFGDAGSLIILFNWDNVQLADRYTIRVLGYDAEGDVPFLAGIPVANPAFRGLQANHWYRLSLRLDFLQLNALTSLSIRDLHTAGPETVFVPPDLQGYYLDGGALPSGLPTALRLFGGGGFPGDHVTGNTLAIDNLTLLAASDYPCFADIHPDGQINLQDLANLLSNFAEPDLKSYHDGDLDCDRDVDLRDLSILLGRFGIVCVL